MHAARETLGGKTNRGLLAAVVVALVLRVGWALLAAQPPPHLTDPWQYQQMAHGFARGDLPAIGDRASAFWPPGYPMALTPLAWIADHTSLSLSMLAALLNALAGTISVVLVAQLARRWIGPAARLPAAWLLAVAPGPIFLTSTSLSETWFTMLLLVTLALVTLAVDRHWSPVRVMGIGALIGYLVLVRTPGVLLLAVVPLTLRATTGRWRGSLRPLGAALVGMVVVLVPWTLRNGLQVGVWTPTSTNNVAFLCLGNGEGSDGRQHLDLAESNRCYRNSPFDNSTIYQPGEVPAGYVFDHPDEPAWYQRTLRATVGYAVRHPLEQPKLMATKLFDTFESDGNSLSDAEGFGRQPLMSTGAHGLLARLADVWLWGVIGLAALGLAFVRRCRAALPVWGLAALQVVLVLPGIGIQRYHQPIVPLLVILAAAVVAAVRQAGRAELDTLVAVDDHGRATPHGSTAHAPRVHPGRDTVATDDGPGVETEDSEVEADGVHGGGRPSGERVRA